jgi:hypothetical protein
MEPTLESLTKQLEEYESQLAVVDSALEEGNFCIRNSSLTFKILLRKNFKQSEII